jgi:hypothetical protein
LTAVLIIRESPFRHPFQALVSTGQIYGNLIYFSTCLFEDFAHGKRYYRPEPYYFWWYFFFMNSFWLFVPASKSPLLTRRFDLTTGSLLGQQYIGFGEGICSLQQS